jgi:uncharacterized protein (DUF697 family)
MSQYQGETGYEFGPAQEMEYGELGEMYGGESPLHEVEEMEYASQLLETETEEELEQFLGDLVKNVAKAAGGFIRSPVGQALTGVLKTAAKQALPLAGGALGTMIAPGVGTALGSKLGSMASNLFEMELEGMDHEQAEFETARRYVQLAAAAAQNAAQAPPDKPPPVVAQQAITSAAERYAPGLLPFFGTADDAPGQSGFGQAPQGYGQHSGRWVRRGRRIILYGA